MLFFGLNFATITHGLKVDRACPLFAFFGIWMALGHALGQITNNEYNSLLNMKLGILPKAYHYLGAIEL